MAYIANYYCNKCGKYPSKGIGGLCGYCSRKQAIELEKKQDKKEKNKGIKQ